jgi:hypothetical protein
MTTCLLYIDPYNQTVKKPVHIWQPRELKTQFIFRLNIFIFPFQGKDRARISKLCKDGKLLEYLDENVQTLHEAFKNGARASSKSNRHGQFDFSYCE